MESEHFPDPTGLRARLEQWTLGLYPACIKYLMSAFDVPEVIRLFPETFYYSSGGDAREGEGGGDALTCQRGGVRGRRGEEE